MVRVGMNAELRWRERARPVDTRLTQTQKEEALPSPRGRKGCGDETRSALSPAKAGEEVTDAHTPTRDELCLLMKGDPRRHM